MKYDNRRSAREKRLGFRLLRGVIRGDRVSLRIIWVMWGRQGASRRRGGTARLRELIRRNVVEPDELLAETYVRFSAYWAKPKTDVALALGLEQNVVGEWKTPASHTAWRPILPFDVLVRFYAKRCFDQAVKANVRKREQIELTSDAIDNLESAATLLERWEEMRLVNLAFAETAEKLFVGALIYGASEIGGLSHSSLEKFLKITNTNSRKKKERFSKTFKAQIRRKFRDGGDAQNGNPSAPFCSSAAFECWGMAPEDAPSPEMWAEIERARNQYENAELFARRQLELKEQARRDEKRAAEFNKRRQFSKSPNDRPPAEEWFGDPWGALQTEQLCFQFAELPSVEASCSRWRAAFNVAVPNENVEVCVASTAQLERGRLFWGQTTIELKRSGGYLRGILPYDNFLSEARASRLRCRLDGFGFGGLSYNFGATDPTRFRELYGRSRR